MTWDDANQAILTTLDVRSEYTGLGLRLAGREPNAKGWIEAHAIDREDRNPSARINVRTGRYVDYGSGLSLSLWDFAAQFGPFADWKAARKHFAKQAGVKLPRGRASKDPGENLEFIDWHEGRVAMWCRHKPPITPDAVRAAGGRLAHYRKQFLVIALPIFGAQGLAAGPVGWTMMNTTGGSLPIYHKREIAKWAKIKTTFGSDQGLLGMHALDRLERDTTPAVIWKVAGPTDLLALFSTIPCDLLDTHLVVSNAMGETENPTAEMVGPFEGRTVYVVHDADQAGEAGAAKWCQWQAGVAAEVRQVKLPYPVEPKHGKDVRDFFAEGNTYAALYELADQVEPIRPAPEPVSIGAVLADDDPGRLARLFLETEGKHLRSWRQEWHEWGGRRYRRVSHARVRERLMLFIEREFHRLNREALEQPGDRPRIPEAKKPGLGLVNNVLVMVSALAQLDDEMEATVWLDASRGPHCVALANGILDIEAILAERSDFLVPHTPLWFSPVCLPYPFALDADCPTWKRTIAENLEDDAERIQLLQEWAGYCLTPDTTQQRFVFLEGEGGNGKSVYCAGLEAMLGLDNVSHVPLESFGGRFALYSTLGKLANIATEVGELDKAAEGVLKSYTAGERMTFDRKGLQPIEAAPTARLLLAANNRPRFSDRSGGLWRRMMVVPFRMTVPPERRVFGLDKVSWWEASGELPGVFNWALAGLLSLRRRGTFARSQQCDAAIEDYRSETNPARMFLLDHCSIDEAGQTICRQLYQAYRDWSGQHGYHPLGEAGFGKEVRRVFTTVTRRRISFGASRAWIYCGLSYAGGDD